MLKSSAISNVIEKVFNRISTETENQAKPQLSDRDFVELYSLFGKTFEEALDILDKQLIVIYKPTTSSHESFREICEISSNSSNIPITYKLFPHINYCNCLEFSTVLNGLCQQYTCKHVLALKLAIILGKTEWRTLTNDKFNFLIKQIN